MRSYSRERANEAQKSIYVAYTNLYKQPGVESGAAPKRKVLALQTLWLIGAEFSDSANFKLGAKRKVLALQT